jgi:hypothetical protein
MRISAKPIKNWSHQAGWPILAQAGRSLAKAENNSSMAATMTTTPNRIEIARRFASRTAGP